MRALAAIVALLLVVPASGEACSFGVSSYFTEVARSFSVVVQFEGKPLAGADVEVFSDRLFRTVSSAKTARDGTVRFRDLLPGKYHLYASHLGIRAGSDQIEIRPTVRTQAKTRLDYRWGEAPIPIRQISGKVTDLRPQGTTLVERITKPHIQVPIAGAKIEIRHPTNGDVYIAESSADGEFAIASVPNRTYVIHAQVSEDPDGAADFLIQVNPATTMQSLRLIKAGGLCGSWAFETVP